MILIKIIIAIALYYFVFYLGGKLMKYVQSQKEKNTSFSSRGVILRVISVLLSASFMTLVILLIPFSFIAPEFAVKHSLSFFSIFLAFMIGVEVTSKNPPNFLLYKRAAIFIILLGLVFWPTVYFSAELLENAITPVVLFKETGMIEFSLYMIGLTLFSPTLVELTERYL